MNNTYCFCKVCAIKVPQIHSDIHINECHAKKKKKTCKEPHPYVKSGEMVSQIQVILENSSKMKNAPLLKKWLTSKEPEFMKSFQYEFSDKFAFFSEFDIHHSRIEEFSAVVLQTDSVENIFIAVSENSELQANGTVRIYEKVLKDYFPIQDDSLFVTVKRINKIEEAKKICLKVDDEVDKMFLFCEIKSRFCTCRGYGWPYLFKKSGIIKMPNLMGEIFEASYDVDEDDSTFKSFISDSFQFPDNSSKPNSNLSLNATMESFKSLKLEDGSTKHSEEDMERTLDTENQSPQIRESFVRSSTPTQETKLRKISKRKEQNSINMSSTSPQISYVEPVNNDIYYWLSLDTIIEIVSENNEMKSYLLVTQDNEIQSYSVPKKGSENSSNKENPYFYKHKQYYLLKEMFVKKLNQSDENPRTSWSAILLLGLSGTGKTTLVNELCLELNLPLKVANMLDYSRSPDFSKYIDNCFQQAMERTPSVLFFDQFDSFGRKQTEFSSKILKNLQSLKISEKSVIVIGATDRPDLVSSHMRQVGRFDKEIILKLPDKNEKNHIIIQMLNNYKNNIEENKIKFLGEICIGFSAADIQYAFRTAFRHAKILYHKEHGSYPKEEDVCLEFESLESIMKSTVPSVLRDKNYSASKVRWEDIFGYEDKKTKLKQIARDISEGECSKGILFYGPPGCSKTMFAKALALETQFSFFTIKCSDLLSKYVGETEKNLNLAIEKAFLSSPALVFMDEIDSLCGRIDGSGGSESCIVPELLSVMRKAHSVGNILFVGATNRPHVLDENLLGAGYFDLLLHFDLPDCSSRCAIWEGILKEVPKDIIHVPTLCQMTEGFTCVEIDSIFQKASYSLIESHYLNLKDPIDLCDLDDFELMVKEEFILQAIANTSPRTSKALLDEINVFAFTRGRI